MNPQIYDTKLAQMYEIQDSVWRTIERTRSKLLEAVSDKEKRQVQAKLQELESAYLKLESAVSSYLKLS